MGQQPTMNRVSPLDYGARPSAIRTSIRRALVAALCVVAMGAAWLLRTKMSEGFATVQLAVTERRCGSFTVPSNLIVYDDGPADRSADTLGSRYSRVQPFAQPDHKWKPLVLWGDPQWQRFSSRVTSDHGCDILVFLHERQSGSGHRRLVAITMYVSAPDPSSRGICLIPCLISISSLAGMRPVQIVPPPRSGTGACVVAWPGSCDLRLFFGQPDLSDQSHFVIPYRAGDVSGQIDGYLGDDDTIRLQPRSGRIRAPGSCAMFTCRTWQLP